MTPPAATLDHPLTADAFAARLRALGPFEARPRLAVAVSGGSDSMALCLLAHAWARARGGQVTALTVDHGLRRESAGEARLVGAWLGRLGIAHAILPWTGAKPKTGIQKRARDARYRLLADWCARAGVLHLLLAHHRDDQLETYLFRRMRGSGPEGLAGMSAIVELAGVRLVRPLLDLPKTRLRATLAAAGQAWIEDPSNVDPAYGRTHVRETLATLAHAGVGSDDLERLVQGFGRARRALEAETAAVIARAVSLHPKGEARLDAAVLRAASPALAVRALGRVLMCLSGRAYAPGPERLQRLYDDLAASRLVRTRTLGGCRIVPVGAALRISAEAPRRAAPWTEVVAKAPQFHAAEGVSSQPHMAYKQGTPSRSAVRHGDVTVSPRHSLSDRGFVIAAGGISTI